MFEHEICCNKKECDKKQGMFFLFAQSEGNAIIKHQKDIVPIVLQF